MEISNYTRLWGKAFLWTNVLELPIYAWFLAPHFRRWWSVCLLVLGINLSTHPALWYVFPWSAFGSDYRPLAIVIGESCVVLIESLLIALCLAHHPEVPKPPSKALQIGFIAAFLANLCSTLLGFLVL